uniref:Uncharacterized protein n=1 Tax=Oryza punctata TaxID=4537 RepID=A0A0E0LVI2_ORYPU
MEDIGERNEYSVAAAAPLPGGGSGCSPPRRGGSGCAPFPGCPLPNVEPTVATAPPPRCRGSGGGCFPPRCGGRRYPPTLLGCPLTSPMWS